MLFLSLTSLACFAAEQYRLGPQDTLSITVLHQPEVSGPVTVAPDGSIRLPVIGELNVNGLTDAECESRILEQLKKRYLSPEVTVALAQPRPSRVYIFGAVKTPGAFELKDTRNVIGAIAAAGGLLFQSNLCTASLYRVASNKTIPLKLTDALAGVESANLPLEVGDVINIEQITLLPVYLSGDAIKAGLYQVPLGTTLSQLISTAGGFLAMSLQSSGATAPSPLKPEDIRIILTRGNENIPVNMPAFIRREAAADIALRAADAIRVESTLFKVYIAGEVRTPGMYMLSPGQGVREAVTLAGGINEALLGKPEYVRIVVTRGNENLPVNVPALNRGDVAANVALNEADAIRVEATHFKVYVSGEVRSPGMYILSQGQGVCEAVTLAGGINAAVNLPSGITERAAPAKTTVAHLDGSQEIVDYPSLLEKGANHPLQEGDRVTVPTSLAKFAVLGMVAAPGAFPLDEHHPPTVMDAIALARGTQPRAVLSSACVIRMVDGKPQRIPVDLHAVLKKNDLHTNITLKADDIVYVPETKVPDWSTISGILVSFYYAHLIL